MTKKDNLVGIDDISVAIPKQYIDAKDLAEIRGVPPSKYTEGIGIEKIAILTGNESVVSLAADAVIDLMQKNDLKPEDIGRIYTATESSVDESKPLVCFVLGKIEEKLGNEYGYRFNHIHGVENKFACIGGSYSLYDTINWVTTGRNNGKVGIVICADEARYDVCSGGEPTQGAGAVAMLIKENPRLINLDFSCVGVFTQNNDDFYRPFGKPTPIVNGDLSNFSYLFSMRTAFDRFKQQYISNNPNLSDKTVLIDLFDYLVFHTPYPKITKHGLAFLFRHELRGTPRWRAICKHLDIKDIDLANNGEDHKIEDIFSNETLMNKDYIIRKWLFSLPEFNDLYRLKTEPSLFAPTNIGNTYTSSIFLSLSSLLEIELIENRVDPGKKVGFGAYGSGSGSMVYSGVLAEGCKDVIKNIGLIEKINARKKLPITDYLLLRSS